VPCYVLDSSEGTARLIVFTLPLSLDLLLRVDMHIVKTIGGRIGSLTREQKRQYVLKGIVFHLEVLFES